MSNIVAIVGRPNVGKSTFFNRLAKSRDAIEEHTSGVTRDRHYGKCFWNGVDFSIIDTGGYVEGSDDIFEEEIGKQVHFAIEEAKVIVFVVDAMEGLTPLDSEVANMLRKTKKKIFLVANKVDNNKLISDAQEFYALGMGGVYCVSSVNGSGTGDFLDDLVLELDDDELDEEIDVPKIAIVGRPNVGKSTLFNIFLGEDRTIVTDAPGTTRDSIYSKYNYYGLDLILVDTAGLRRKAKVREDIEFFSVMRSVRAIEKSDICVLVIDATKGLESQDQSILSLIEKNNKGVVIIVNKWDLIEKESNTHKEVERFIREKTAPLVDIPIIFTSAINKQRVFKVLQEACDVYKRRNNKISTSELNDFFLKIIENNPPPSVKGKYVKIKYVTQLQKHYPAFVFFCNFPQYVGESYTRFLENRLRESFDYTGVPIQIYFRRK